MSTCTLKQLGAIAIPVGLGLAFVAGRQAVQADPGTCITCECKAMIAWMNAVTGNVNGMKTQGSSPVQINHCLGGAEAAACSFGDCQSNGTGDLYQYNDWTYACINPQSGWSVREVSVTDTGWVVFYNRPWQTCQP